MNEAVSFTLGAAKLEQWLRRLTESGISYVNSDDLKSHSEAQESVGRHYADRKGWAGKAILNVASSGKFSSDRTIADYAREIWGTEPCPIP